jgi:antitoxin HicB
MQSKYEYPASIEPDEAGRFLVHFPDLPETLTDGATIEEARAEAADCLTEAIAGRIADGEAVPTPSPGGRGHYVVAARPEIALKAALHAALAARQATAADLARALGIDHKEARRLLDPGEASKLPRLTDALAALDFAVSISVFDRSVRRRLLTSPMARRARIGKGVHAILR